MHTCNLHAVGNNGRRSYQGQLNQAVISSDLERNVASCLCQPTQYHARPLSTFRMTSRRLNALEGARRSGLFPRQWNNTRISQNWSAICTSKVGNQCCPHVHTKPIKMPTEHASRGSSSDVKDIATERTIQAHSFPSSNIEKKDHQKNPGESNRKIVFKNGVVPLSLLLSNPVEEIRKDAIDSDVIRRDSHDQEPLIINEKKEEVAMKETEDKELKELEIYLRKSKFYPELQNELHKRCLEVRAKPDKNHLSFNITRTRSGESLSTSFGYPPSERDLRYDFDLHRGITQESKNALQLSLQHQLKNIRDCTDESCTQMGEILARQAEFRIITEREVNIRLGRITKDFCHGRDHVLAIFRQYAKTHRWIDEVYSNQRKGNLRPEQQKILRCWLFDNMVNPYPSRATKDELVALTGLSQVQLNNFLINQRSRVVRPFMDLITGRGIKEAFGLEEEEFVL